MGECTVVMEPPVVHATFVWLLLSHVLPKPTQDIVVQLHIDCLTWRNEWIIPSTMKKSRSGLTSLAAFFSARVRVDTSTGTTAVLFQGHTHKSNCITSYDLGEGVWAISDLLLKFRADFQLMCASDCQSAALAQMLQQSASR
jgi:hypothetical protein